MMRPICKWLGLSAIALYTLSMTSCKKGQEVQTQSASYPTVKVSAGNKNLTTSYSAAIRGKQDIDVFPQVSGTIEKVCVSEGQNIRKGQVLFVIDQVPYKAALKTALANQEAAKASLSTAELNYNSNKELYAQKVVSEFTLKTSENNYLTAKAQLAQAEAQVVTARNNLSYTEVKSPSNGVIGMLPFRIGALVSPQMSQPLTTVSDNTDMYVYFSMTENQLLKLTREHGSKDKAIAQIPEIQIQLNDGSIYDHTGKIESISGVIDRTTGTVGVRAVFPNPDKILTSGGSGRVLIPSIYENCIIIPQGATIRMQDKYLVYKVVDGNAVSTLIKVDEINDGREYIVHEGLNVGDEIVSEGAGLIREGMKIK